MSLYTVNILLCTYYRSEKTRTFTHDLHVPLTEKLGAPAEKLPFTL